jgi:copper/silver efflux system protein
VIGKLIEWSLKNRLLVLAIYILIVGAGIWAIFNTPVDAIPDIGELQVIVFADWAGRSPRDIEDQIIYPLTTNLLGIPKVKTIRSSSAFGFGMVNIIFDDGTDYYWARTRVLERLNYAQKDLPPGVTAVLGPDATALGQVFWYTVENGYFCPEHPELKFDGEGNLPEEERLRLLSTLPKEVRRETEDLTSYGPGRCPFDGRTLIHSQYDLGRLRSVQDWYVRYALNSVPGVSEVASVGGYIQQYQIDVDPNKLTAYNIRLSDVFNAVRRSNIDVGAKVFEEGGVEFIVRGIGFIKSVTDVEEIVVGAQSGVPIYIRSVAAVHLGPEFRRGALDKEGAEVTGGVVVMRYGENPLTVIEGIKEKIEELSPGLPPGVRIVPFYDRTGLIKRAVATLRDTLLIEILITIAVIGFFLLHFSSSLIVSLVLPVGVLISFILMRFIGVDSNIMSLGGIAIAIGVMVDAGIVMTENIYRHLAEAGASSSGKLTSRERVGITITAAKEVGHPVLFALLTTIVSFIPVFSLSGQAGRLFKPLAFTKTFAMVGAAVIALTLIPVLASFFLRGSMKPAGKNRTARILKRIYRPVLGWSLKHKWVVMTAAVLVLALGIFLAPRISTEFMPPLNEGDLLFMPVLLPGASLTQVKAIMKTQDIILASEFPEVAGVVGKLGRAETPTDPAPVLMIESVINLKPESEWPARLENDRWYTRIPLAGDLLKKLWPKRRLTRKELINRIWLGPELKIPGVSNIVTQPIRNRIDMLATGIQTPIGVKVFGDDLKKIEEIAIEVEKVVSMIPGAVAPFAERIGNRPYLEIEIDRKEAARYGIRLGDVQDVIETAIGGKNLTATVEGRERYPVRVRYLRELRDNLESLNRILVPAPMGARIPISQLAKLTRVPGPAKIGSENTTPYARVFISVDPEVTGVVDFVQRARKIVREKVKLPAGYYITWSGQWESEQEANQRIFGWRIWEGEIGTLWIALFVILLLLYMAFKSVRSLLVVSTGLPISLIGGIIFIWLLDIKMSVAVWVGFIALFGVATDNALVLVSCLDGLFKKKDFKSIQEIRKTVVEGGLLRIRPAMMTTTTTILALLPIMFFTSTGSEVMKPMAAPTVGGLITATLSNMILVPALYCWLAELKFKIQAKACK